MSNILPVIMAGGTGSRLWPMSRTHYPKQFLNLSDSVSMLQSTIKRLDGLDCSPASIICNEEHRFLVAEQLRSCNLAYSSIILEPFGRNTAPAVALAAFDSMKNGDDPILLVLAADHMIKNETSFRDNVKNSIKQAEEGFLVTFGIVPTKPETGYGYIRRGKSIIDSNAFVVEGFVEKPDLHTAEKYLLQGGYYWNSGMFMFKASRYLDELKKFRNDIYDSVKKSYLSVRIDLDFTRIDEQEFSRCPDESIDYAVMENTSDAIVVPLDVGWSDVGAWSSLWEISDKDDNENVIRGDIIADTSKRCFIHAEDRLITTVGIEDLVIVDTKDALLVAHRDKVQNVKNIVSILKENARNEVLHHREVYRPYGKHDHIAEGERYHVKKVIVKPGQKTSMQLHYHRAEHWIVVSGTAKVYRGSDIHIIPENESIYIPIGIEHCFENPGKINLEIIEVRTGIYLSEDDIHRSSIDTK
ncbi:mannose-1-phosphate guanylyltransferase/mannose-6-phosphate isomerase [Providencia huaxiensis]|uniref:mannose-1-phosphate guanylyltransferase/mannose-6-phosphate isomerase n=1 Tax=Providencia huaxiensis TaxID=2027290 RepID=UPI0024AB1750|nr:mannose-1-phosphate guanylyltransferase/mannose-6-phosphate isomerase [Providencia rettgeri]ELR5155982.1 mannose-1-phosphate guanylyltransferase/mannose-6-phosphate isomerase [Providencia rettgeri]